MLLKSRIESESEFAAEPVEFADGEDDVAHQLVVQFAEFVRMLAKSTEMLAEFCVRERRGACGLKRDVRADGHARSFNGERLFGGPAHGQRDGLAAARRDVSCVALLESLIQRRIVRFPHAVSGTECAEVDLPVLEIETRTVDLIDATALLGIGVPAGVEDHTVAGLEVDFLCDLNVVASHSRDATGKRPALFPRPGGHELLMIDSVHPSGKKAARECHFELIPIGSGNVVFPLRQRGIERLAIDLTDRRDVFGGFQPSFDFEARDSACEQRGNLRNRSEVLRREQVTAVPEIAKRSIDDQFVGHPAGLRAFSAVGAALAEALARETLPAVCDAERTVDEGFERQHRVKFLQLAQAQLTGQHCADDAEFLGKRHAFRRSNRHLRARVDRQIGNRFAGKPDQSDILHNQRIDARTAAIAQHPLRRIQLACEHERVERDIRLHAMPVAELHHIHEFIVAEIIRPQPGIESRQAKVNRIRAIGHCGAQAIPAARRREQFGQIMSCIHH